MATAGRAGRAERLNERLRGAQRANVEADESFQLDLAIPGLSQPAVPSSSPKRTSPRSRKSPQDGAASGNRSAIRSSEGRETSSRPSNSTIPVAKQTPPRRSRKASDRPDSSGENAAITEGEAQNQSTPEDPARASLASVAAAALSVEDERYSEGSRRKRPRPGVASQTAQAIPRPAILPAGSPTARRLAQSEVEEIEESPAHAPGSGRRRRIQGVETIPSSVRLQKLMSVDAEEAAQSSSPIGQKVQRNEALASAKSRRTTGPRSLESAQDQEEEHEASNEEAEEIDIVEAARTLGKRRRRQSSARRSPELGGEPQVSQISPNQEQQQEEEEEEEEELPQPKRRRGRMPAESPAKQKQPVARTLGSNKPKPTIVTRKPLRVPSRQSSGAADTTTATRAAAVKQVNKEMTKKRKEKEKPGRKAEHAIDITVQHFVNMGKSSEPGLAIPFANRSGDPSVIDVFAQVCGEVVEQTIAQLAAVAESATDKKDKKALQIKMRAIEAYWGELDSRLLQHAIHLNHWHSLRKQLKDAQKQRTDLRTEILRLRGEREQVALQMDAVRIKHERDKKEATSLLDASALMQDIELAVEQGRHAPEPSSRAAKQQAELGNLELAVARIAEEASSSSATGGMLKQAREFNTFLERVALALERR